MCAGVRVWRAGRLQKVVVEIFFMVEHKDSSTLTKKYCYWYTIQCWKTSSGGQGKIIKEKEFKYILLEIYLRACLDLRTDQETCTGLLQLGSFSCC